MKVGFIGIGAIGLPMSRHVLEAGYNLVVNDIRKDAARELLSWGQNGQIIRRRWPNAVR